MRSTSTTSPDAPRWRDTRRARAHARQVGFTLVSAVFLLVVLAALGAGLASVSLRQHRGSAAEIDAVRALQAARAGLEWAAFQVLRLPAPPAPAPGCFAAASFVPDGLPGMTVTVRCTRTPPTGTLVDGGAEHVFFELVANACSVPAGGGCPAPGTPQATYVERQLTWTVRR